MTTLGFIGAGNMATAIIGGISRAKLGWNLTAYDVDSSKTEKLKQYGVVPATSAVNMLKGLNGLLFAIKPQNFPEVLEELKPALDKDVLLISIAAGITPEYISSALGFSAKVVQVMPNTPLLLGYGATALSKSERVSDDEFLMAQKIFNCSGITAILPNRLMNEVIALNGSSPAFIYRFAKGFIDYGKSVGIAEDVCLKLFAQSLIGSAEMMTKSGHSIDELIQMVSSKGGTTIAGLEGMEENHIGDAVQEACERCTRRAYELAKK